MEKYKGIILLVLLLAAMAMLFLHQKLEEQACNAFGDPLFTHALPDNAVLVQQDAAKDEEGGVTAVLLLQTEWTSDALEAFYSDTDYPPAEDGQTVVLKAKALDKGSLDALQQAGLYEEGASYQFVYLYSK